jgi:hypothetical protein
MHRGGKAVSFIALVTGGRVEVVHMCCGGVECSRGIWGRGVGWRRRCSWALHFGCTIFGRSVYSYV